VVVGPYFDTQDLLSTRRLDSATIEYSIGLQEVQEVQEVHQVHGTVVKIFSWMLVLIVLVVLTEAWYFNYVF
tara:strand:+ start:1644 stop:1859 length:216 start_codon:yes stop_codon:yes gene_type:complete